MNTLIFGKHFEPEVFTNNGDIEASTWLRRYELFARKSNWSDIDKVELLELYLTGKNLSWFERLDTNNLTWESLKEMFIEKFESQETELKAWKELQLFNYLYSHKHEKMNTLIFGKHFEPEVFTNNGDIEASTWLRRYELFARKSNWSDIDKVELLELYLTGKNLSWFERLDTNNLTWESLKEMFIEKFESQETELKAWKELQLVRQAKDEEVEDLADDTVKFRCLLTSINSNLQRVIIKKKVKTYKDAILAAAEEEKLEKVCEFENNQSNKSSKVDPKSVPKEAKESENDMFEKLIKKFDQLSLNLVEIMAKSSQRPTNKPYQPADASRVLTCFNCRETGQISRNCPKAPRNSDKPKTSNNNDFESKPRGNSNNSRSVLNDKNSKNLKPESLDIEDSRVEKEETSSFVIENCDVEAIEIGEREREMYLAEKRKVIESEELARKRVNIASNPISNNMAVKNLSGKIDENRFRVPNKPITEESMEIEDLENVNKKKSAVLRKKKDITLNSNHPKYSIKSDLSSINANITFSQLLQSSPEIRTELIKLCRKVDVESNLNAIENQLTTNCKSIVKVFGKSYVAIVDTGAACSVITSRLLDEMGLAPDKFSDQTIITADGKGHNTLGVITQLPITIAGYRFAIDLLVMENNKRSLILGVDWLKNYDATIDVKIEELVLPFDNYDVVLSLCTTLERDLRNGLSKELFGIGKHVCEIETVSDEIVDSKIVELVEQNSDILAADYTELVGTDIVQHEIDTGD
ncbi:hypothetical protein BB558_003011, partial [Smittium angustum]